MDDKKYRRIENMIGLICMAICAVIAIAVLITSFTNIE